MSANQGLVPRTGEELRSWRVEAGLIQSELARRLNLTKRTIGNWEQRGTGELPPKAIRRLTEIVSPGATDVHETWVAEAERILTVPMEGRDHVEVVAEQLRAIGLLLLDKRQRGMISIPDAWIG
ncbi:helix-turn-helix domain-containing protein [Arthrobacter sp. GAS37]|uniref:helix-turn-helix domain-containing protein n=1 Tax=Arthrobacter sp. GAS37 TaxID=3156261 RepID=UPI0038504ED4